MRGMSAGTESFVLPNWWKATDDMNEFAQTWDTDNIGEWETLLKGQKSSLKLLTIQTDLVQVFFRNTHLRQHKF